MMKTDFLLKTKTANTLYNHVKDLPIIDYHNHLSLSDISANRRFYDVYDLWIRPDPYKHRAMRMCGVPENYITGNATNEEKFVKWCETLPKLQLNPLSHWSKMEIEKIFGIQTFIDGDNAKNIYTRCNDYLKENEITVDSLMNTFNVEYAFPCASLIDDISLFEKSIRFAPSLRGDDIVCPSQSFIETLEKLTGIEITDLQNYEKAIGKRLDAFSVCGCRFSDNAIDNNFKFYKDDGANDKRFCNLLNGCLDLGEKEKLVSYLLVFLGKEYEKRGFIMQLHIGAQRYTSSRLRMVAGAAGGFASIGNSVNVSSLTEFLDTLDRSDSLPKTVLFTLNPADNALISVLSGSYAKDGVSGLITQGPAWWWCDHKFGIVEMLENTANFGVLNNFIGMTTDSRSFLSFVRHDYYRRVLCNWLGDKWEKEEILCDMQLLKQLVYALCYKNVKTAVEL